MDTKRDSDLDLAAKQLRAIDAWNRARRVQEAAQQRLTMTREMRLDASRRREVLRREHEALVGRAHAQLEASGRPLASTGVRRLLVVHRDPRFRERVGAAVLPRRLAVCGWTDNGADAVGMAVAEQPDVVLLEEALPMVAAEEVVRDVALYCPDTRTAVQVRDGSRVGRFLDAGAATAFSRQLHPDAVAEQLLALLPR